MVENHEFNLVSRTVLHFALSESGLAKKLTEGRNTARSELSRNILNSLEMAGGEGKAGIVTAGATTFDAVVSKAIADLGVLEQFAKGPEPESPDGAVGEQSGPAALNRDGAATPPASSYHPPVLASPPSNQSVIHTLPPISRDRQHARCCVRPRIGSRSMRVAVCGVCGVPAAAAKNAASEPVAGLHDAMPEWRRRDWPHRTHFYR